MMSIVAHNPPKKAVPTMANLSNEARLKVEDDNNLRSIPWARANLPM